MDSQDRQLEELPLLGTTGGSGGATGVQYFEPYVFEGLSADYVWYAPEAGRDRALGLAVLLQGDGNNESGGFVWDGVLQQWADETGAVILNIAPPSGTDSFCFWTPKSHDRARYLASLLETKVFPAFDIDLERVHLGGISGGAFWSFGAPFYTELPFHGGIVGVCGGDIPREQSATDYCATGVPEDAALEARDGRFANLAKLHSVYAVRTDDDVWLPWIDDGLALWKELGADTKLVSAGPGEHCAFDLSSSMRDALLWADERVRR